MRSVYSGCARRRVGTIGSMMVTVLPCARMSSRTRLIGSVAMPLFAELGGHEVARSPVVPHRNGTA